MFVVNLFFSEKFNEQAEIAEKEKLGVRLGRGKAQSNRS